MKNLLTLLALCFLFCLQGFTQARKISGRISNEKGEPVAFASVKIKGKNTGVSSDENGRYSISALQGEVLIISSASITTKEVTVGATDVLDIQVTVRDAVLGEVLVTALGIKREKRQLSYSVQTVNADQLGKSGSGNALSELNGKVSGLTVINSTGDPGGGSYFRLRGVTSVTGNNQPLIVVDGVPINNSINNYDPNSATPDVSNADGNLTSGTQPTNRGVDINPNDIESITLLKGPAAAIYGIQAASGALIITTKKGGSGRTGPSITFSSSASFQRVNKLPKRQTRFAQGTSINPFTGVSITPVWIGPDGTYGDGSPAMEGGYDISSEKRLTWGPSLDTMYHTGVADNYDPNGRLVGQSSSAKAMKAAAYDPYDFFRTGFTFDNNVSVSGGNAKSGFRLSLGNLHQDGVIPRTNYDKTTLGLNGQSAISDKLTVSSGINFIHSKSYKVQQGSNQSGVMLGLLRTPTTFDNANGLGKDAYKNPASYVLQDGTGTQRSYRGGIGYDNPYWVINKNPFWEELYRTFGFAQASYQANDWLSVMYRVGGDVYAQTGKNAFDIGSNAFNKGALHLLNYFYKQFNSDFTINLKKRFSDDWNGSLLLGHNYYTYTRNARLTHGSTFAIPEFYDLLNIVSYRADETTEKKRTMAFYGEAHLDYKDMVFLTVTGRRETSSTLPVKNNSFFYPSAGLAWEFTRLPSYPSGSVLNYGKIRASFAQVGKDAPVQGLTTDYVRAQLSDGFTTGIAFPIFDVPAVQLSSTIATIGNPDLKAEKTNSYEVGADLGFLNNRIGFNGTFYYSKSSDVILVAPLAYSTGYSSKLVNAATIRNYGVELTLTTTPVKTDVFTWDMNINWSFNKNKVLALAPGIDKVLIGGFTNGEVDAIAGKPFGQIYGNIYVRSNPNDMNSPLLINDDASSAGYGMPIVSSQSGAIGDINPDWTGSVINNLAYKGFVLGIQLDVRKGGDIWNGTKGAMSYFGTSKETENRGTTTVFKGLLGHLNTAGEVVNGPGDAAGAGAENNVTATYNQYYWQNIGSNFIGPSEVGVEDASFVRIRQLSLGYDLPKSFIRKAKLSMATVTLFSNNPVLWTKYSGVDPETSLAGPANGQGVDYFNNPGTKSYGIRLNVAF